MTTSLQNKAVSLVAFLFLVLLSCGPAIAQTFQFLPEVDIYNRLQPDTRFNFRTMETSEAGDPTQIEIGPGFDFFLKPLVRLKDITAFDLDDAKTRPLQFSVAFRYVPSPDKPHVERLELAVTPLAFLRQDSPRGPQPRRSRLVPRPTHVGYRNKVTLERRFSIKSYHPAPYISAEAFYQSQYEKWATTALYVGCLLPLGKYFEFDTYYEHQNVTNERPNQQFSQFGLVLKICTSSGNRPAPGP